MHSTRYALAAIATGSLVTTAATAQDGTATAATLAESVVATLLQQSHEGNAALLRGDVERYRTLIPIARDFTLMSPFGGQPTHASQMTEDRWQSVGRFFRDGKLEQDLVHAYATPGMVVLAVIERAHVAVGDLAAQDWALRVTLVYRRDGDQWRLVHRHADPLATGISVRQSAALARGEPVVD